MASASNPVSTSTALVPYDPTLPHISIKSHLEAITDKVAKRSLELAKFEALHLSPLEQKWKERVVSRTAQGLIHLYIDKEMGQKMAYIITRNFRRGDYDSAANPFAFKQQVFDDLRAVCPDKHLSIFCTEHPIPEYDPDRSLKTLKDKELTTQQRQYLDRLSAGEPDFSKEVEALMLPGTKIGYFKINVFPLPDQKTKAIIDTAMQNIIDADALIIDLRNNCGGNPGTVAFLASYFFDEKQLINQIYTRETDQLTSYYVEPERLARRFGVEKPIYVLTSGQTFSAGEELAYDLQSAGRATIVGQVTAGGAHPVRAFVIDDRIYATIPFERAVNPYTGTNWEGIGVIPNHSISSEVDALTYVQALVEQ